MNASEWIEIKLFISSTFNDMHAERDYLVTEVFPLLREWCEARRIRLTDIDLRWGVTSDNPEMGNTVLTCLRCVDECRPFFLCFVGQRRGWVPNLEKYATGEAVAEYEGLELRIGKRSITEMEIEHAVLAPMVHILSGERSDPERCRALFFFREDPFRKGQLLTPEQREIYMNAAAENESEEDIRLRDFKQRIEAEWKTFHYTCRWDPDIITEELHSRGAVCQGKLTDFSCEGTLLRDLILSELEKMIEHEFPDRKPATASDPFDEDALEQHLLAQTSCFDFVGQESALQRIRAFLDGDPGEQEQALCIASREGLGSTALLGRIWSEQQKTGRKVIMRSCGTTDKSATEQDLYLSIGNECGIFRASEVDPKEVSCLNKDFFDQMLKKGWDALIIDGMEKIQSKAALAYIRGIPPGFRLIVSSADPENDFQKLRFPYTKMELTGLKDPEERRQMIRTFLKRSLKSLSLEQEKLLISSDAAEIPLYLKIACNELKNYGSNSGLTGKVTRFGNTLEEAFTEVLRSVEDEWGENETVSPCLAGLFCFSRDGLNEDELFRALKHFGLSGEEVRYRVRMLLRRLRPYLGRVNCRFSIQNKNLRLAAGERYADRETECRKALVGVYTENLRALPNPAMNEGVTETHGSRELIYQQVMLNDRAGLHQTLFDDTLFSKIPPSVYLCSTKNGPFYANDENLDLGFSTGSIELARMRCRLLAESLLEKANSDISEICRNYPKNRAEHCRMLRQKEDQTEFYHYRDLFYETADLARAVSLLQKRALEGAASLDEIQELEQEYRRFANGPGYRNVFSFMFYLSINGSDETDLSHAIEDMGDTALSGEKKIDQFIAAEKNRLAES